MGEILIEFIVRFFVEFIFEIILMGSLRGIHLVGIFVLKLMTFSKLSITELKVKYKGSSKPYFIGFGLFFFGIYFLLKWAFS